MRKAMLIVEKDFENKHIGVRRVIFYYKNLLEQSGYETVFATPTKKGISIYRPKVNKGQKRDVTPTYSRWRIKHKKPLRISQEPTFDYQPLEINDFDVSIITNPWLVKHFSSNLLNKKFTFGLVYDVVPNLMAVGILNFGRWLDVGKFAHEHSVGIEFFLKQCSRILTISNSTKSDLLHLFKSANTDLIEVHVPFTPTNPHSFANEKKAEKVRILILNGLDFRKNIDVAVKAFEAASKKIKLQLVFVGEERIPRVEVKKLFEILNRNGIKFTWHRKVTDRQLARLFDETDFLFFPSIYEGLGLPILEAQDRGVPVVSSNTSSCVEINLNKSLQCEAQDWKTFGEVIVNASRGLIPLIAGESLHRKQIENLKRLSKSQSIAALTSKTRL